MEEFTLAMRRGGLSPQDKLLKISGPQISWNALFLVPLNLKVLQKSVINSLPLYHSSSENRVFSIHKNPSYPRFCPEAWMIRSCLKIVIWMLLNCCAGGVEPIRTTCRACTKAGADFFSCSKGLSWWDQDGQKGLSVPRSPKTSERRVNNPSPKPLHLHGT